MVNSKSAKGFTLIEILVALAIFAVIGVAAATCLHQMVRYRTRLSAQADQWRLLAIAHLLIQKDVSNAISLNQQDVDASLLSPFSGQPGQMSLTRWNHLTAAWVKDAPLFSTVSYSVSDHKLMRSIQLPGGKAFASPIITGVIDAKFSYYDPIAEGWDNSWQMHSAGLQSMSVSNLPPVIRLKMQLKGVGKIQWDFGRPMVSG